MRLEVDLGLIPIEIDNLAIEEIIHEELQLEFNFSYTSASIVGGSDAAQRIMNIIEGN